MSSALRSFIRSCLIEAAVSPAAAIDMGHALFTGDSTLMLYRVPDVLDFEAAPIDVVTDHCVGAMRLRRSIVKAGAPQQVVAASVAEHGFGPLLYDAALSLGPFIVPDRDSVSDEASRVWRFYAERRADDIEAITLRSASHPDEPWLDRGYRLRDMSRVEPLKDAHVEFVDAVRRETGMSRAAIDGVFVRATRAYTA